MIVGRILWGISSMIVYGAMGKPFTWSVFFAGAVGILLHIIVVPVLVFALQKAQIITK